jgi:FAD/FMN-containing dehydrogenase
MNTLFSAYSPIDGSEKYEKGYRYGHGKALCIVRPKTTAEVSQILKICNDHKIGVVPQGGNTGLVGSSNPDSSGKQIVLSTELLNKDIYQLDAKNKTVRIGAGWVLDALNEKLSDNNLFLPIDIGSSGTCNIGGIIATNAAGTRSGRYGNAKSRVVEFTVVLANGEIIVAGCQLPVPSKGLPQDNSKLDFTNPFIGSQGWLGVITEAVMRLEQRPVQSESVVLVPGNDAAIKTIREKFEQEFGDSFTAFEGMSDIAMHLVAKHIPNTRYLFEDDPQMQGHDYALLVEVSSTYKNENLRDKLLDTMSELMTSGHVVTGLEGKSETYWHVRHHISEAIKKEGDVIATDIAIPGNGLAQFRRTMEKKLNIDYSDIVIVPFGHEMIGALHYNIVWPKDSLYKITADIKRAIQEKIYDEVVRRGGTYSTEHGIGPHNQWAYDKYTPEEVKKAARVLKRKFDERGILNPNVRY